MARSSRMSVQKRLRERKKAEKAELKRISQRRAAGEERPGGAQVAEYSDLEAYGLVRTAPDPHSET